MNRNLIAGLFALAVLPATAVTAGAREPNLGLTARTHQLACKIGSDGESLQIRINVQNTSGRVIPKGARIQLTVRTLLYTTTMTSEAYRDVQPGQTIPLSAPPKRSISCKASVTFSPLL
jgi:hypothetical protein